MFFLGDCVDLDLVSEDSEKSDEESTDAEDEVESCLRGTCTFNSVYHGKISVCQLEPHAHLSISL